MSLSELNIIQNLILRELDDIKDLDCYMDYMVKLNILNNKIEEKINKLYPPQTIQKQSINFHSSHPNSTININHQYKYK